MSTSASILVVEDQPAMLDNIRLALEMLGYRVLTSSDGVQALEVLESHAVDLILADIAMPLMNGYQLYERVIQNPRWVAIPFIFITARALDSDIRYGKELGVDDYLTKPLHLEDLRAAVQGRLRRARQLAQLSGQSAGPSAAQSDTLIIGKLRLVPAERRAWMDDKLVSLSAREFTLLEYVARQAGRVVPLTELCQVTHGLETDHTEAGGLLYPLVRSLRRKLGYAVGETGCIESVRGVGYRIVMPQPS
jgi:DNA-binding response OmpR family regulator